MPSKSRDDPYAIGSRYGKLTILEVIPDHKTKVRCRCDCGVECIKIAYSVKGGSTKSCGCGMRDNKNGSPYQIGEKHGRLTIIEVLDTRPRRVKCRCDCGNITEHDANSVRQGDAKSCGCLRRENGARTLEVNRYIPKKNPDKPIRVRRSGEPITIETAGVGWSCYQGITFLFHSTNKQEVEEYAATWVRPPTTTLPFRARGVREEW